MDSILSQNPINEQYIDHLKQVRIIITHADCVDGIASAIIIADAIKAKHIQLYVGSQQHLELEPEPGMLFCDCSPKTKTKRFLEAGAMVFDHHESAKEITQQFVEKGLGYYGETNNGIAGAKIAYQLIWFPLMSPFIDWTISKSNNLQKLAELASIRDTWQKNNPLWEEANILGSTLRFYPFKYWMDKVSSEKAGEFSKDELLVGKISYEKYLKQINKVADTAFHTIWADKKISVFSANGHFTSDVSELLRKRGQNITVGFSFNIENNIPKVCYSVRSDESFDCAQFCKHFGGGGHIRAAGFSVPVYAIDQNPFGLIIKLLNLFSVKEQICREKQPPDNVSN